MMEESVVDRFVSVLDRLEVGWTRCTPPHFAEALEAAVTGPAVGVPLPFEEVALDDVPPNGGKPGSTAVTLGPTAEELRAARTGITAAFLGIADYGSVVIRHGGGAEAVSLFPERHVAVLRAADVVPGMPDALARLAAPIREEGGSFVIATGPSATADMGALVRGAHGPREVHVILLEASAKS